jgi:hypothetical protein
MQAPLADLPRPHPSRHHAEYAIRVPGILVYAGIHAGIEPACRGHVDRQMEPVCPYREQRHPDNLRAAARHPGIAFRAYRRRGKLRPGEDCPPIELNARQVLQPQPEETAQELGRTSGAAEANRFQAADISGYISYPIGNPVGAHR